MTRMKVRLRTALVLFVAVGALSWTAPPRENLAALTPVEVEAQPLAANIQRLIEALEFLGAPLPAALAAELTTAGRARDAKALQELLDGQVLLAVHINPEARVQVTRGSAAAVLQQAGYTPMLVKIVNESGSTGRLRITSPQSGPVYAGMAKLSAERMQQEHLRENENTAQRTNRARAAACRSGHERPRRGERRSAGRRTRTRRQIHGPCPAEQLGRIAAVPAAPHQSGHCAGRGKTYPSLASERRVGSRVHRPTLARARAPHCVRPARRCGTSVRAGTRDLPADCG